VQRGWDKGALFRFVAGRMYMWVYDQEGGLRGF
jgi:hypothetical protein